MKLILSEEQQFLKDTAQSFARDKTPVTHFRELRDSENAQCWDCLLYTSPSPRDPE